MAATANIWDIRRSARARFTHLEVLRRPAHRNDGCLDRRDPEHVPGAGRRRRGTFDPAARAAAARRPLRLPDHGRGLRRRPGRRRPASRSRATTSTIKGVDTEGRRYHALNPETFYWAHATFFMLVIKVAEYFCGGPDRGREASALRRARAVVPDVRDEHAAGAQLLGGISGLLGARRPRRAGGQPGHPGHLPDADSQAELRADAHAHLGPDLQAAGGRAALDRGRPVRARGPREGGHALDTRRRDHAAGVRQGWSSWRSWRFPTKSGCIRARWRPTGAREGRIRSDAPLVEAPAFVAAAA